MEFKLIIDPESPETVVVTAKEQSALVEAIEDLVVKHRNALTAFTEEDMVRLQLCDIACISVLDGKTRVIDRNGREFRVRQRLYELEPLLGGRFIRINRSAFANEDHLDRFQACFSGAVDAVFTCGYREYVSRRCFAQIKRRYVK